ncbi:MAG: hypothetical protein RL194_1132, partial [Pseudomonadota bacterium]
SLAGLRVGYALGHRDLIEALTRVKDSFNSYPIDSLAMAGAMAAMEDREYFEATCRQVIDSRERLIASMRKLGFEVLPSGANFIFARFPGRDGAELAASLRERNIVIRHFKKPQRIAPYLRITIGTEQQNRQLIEGLQAILDS